jgi:glycosyltransferase involved in cell wall biosynthesis
MTTRTDPLQVLHVVGGADARGGVMSFVASIAGEDQDGVENFIWKHRDFKVPAKAGHYVCEGKTRKTDRSLPSDLLGALKEVLPLCRWTRRQARPLLYAHSRLGIFASSIASVFTKTPLLIHLHALARRSALYSILWRLARAQPIFNSSMTCRHYGGDPARSLIVMPPLQWPKPAAERKNGPIRFVASGAFVRGKHFDVLVAAFKELQQGSMAAELHIYGLASDPADPACQDEILEHAQGNPAIHLHKWDPHWAEHLASTDVFVHLGLPEAFGMVILEAFARGCRLVVMHETFLNDLQPPLDSAAILRVKNLSVAEVMRQMRQASAAIPPASNLWELRRAASPLFSIEESRAKLARIYRAQMG